MLDNIEKVLNLWTVVFSAITAVTAYIASQLNENRKRMKRKTAHEVEILSIRALISSASGIEPGKLTLDAIRTILSQSAHDLEEMNSFIRAIPNPYVVWIKKRKGPKDYEMIQVNDHYALTYLGKPAEYYKGKSDKQIWGEETAKAFAENDEKTYRDGTSLRIIEETNSPLTGVRGYFHGVKFVFQTSDNIYVCGLGRHIDEKDKDALPKLQTIS